MANTRRASGPVVIIAFQGWNDAADAATSVIDFLADNFPTDPVVSVDDEEYFDFQATRPTIMVNDHGERELIWPTITVELCHLPKRELMLISGPEPNLRWREFSVWIESITSAINPAYIVLLGAMLTDAPHTRPFEVSGQVPRSLNSLVSLEPSDYEGPIGIIGVLARMYEGCAPTKLVTMWVSVPHYTAPPPNPKAGLALLQQLEAVLGIEFDLKTWADDTAAWEERINQLVEEDPDMAEYVESLENQTDSETVPHGTGDQLAEAFEEYLSHRRRPDGS